jgi:hypothetical protein
MPDTLDHVNGLSTTESTRVATAAEQFEAAWRAGAPPAIEAYLPAGPARGAVLRELVHLDLEYRRKAGEGARVEDYLARFPELAGDRTAVLALVLSELELRGRQPDPMLEEYGRRFPDLYDAIRGERLGRRPAGPPGGPAPGGLGRFELREVLGSGSFGVVWKAWDRELGRAVAV